MRHNPETALATHLLLDPGRRWGYELSRASGVSAFRMYPILEQWLTDGWLLDGWEDGLHLDAGRSPRRYYVLTDAGRAGLRALLRRT